MGTVMVQRMNAELSTLISGADQTGQGLGPLVQNPNAFLEPMTRQSLSPAMVGMFQSLLAEALHSVFLVGTVVSILGLLAVAMMPAVKLSHFGK